MKYTYSLLKAVDSNNDKNFKKRKIFLNQEASSINTGTLTFDKFMKLNGKFRLLNLFLFFSLTLFAQESNNERVQKLEDITKRGLDVKYHQDNSGKTRDDLYRKSFEEFLKVKNGFTSVLGNSKSWQLDGPAPANVNSYINLNGQLPGPNAGAVMDIAIDPYGSSDNIVYVASEEGGIWKTTNGGKSWSPKTDTLQTLSFGAIAIDPSNSNNIYAGTGNIFNQGGFYTKNSRYYKAVGIYSSTDGGTTWRLTAGSAALNGIGINKMVMPSSGVLIIATNSGLFRSTDSGTTYTQITIGGNTGQYITDLDMQDGNPNSIWASVSGKGIYYSSNQGLSFGGNLWSSGNGSVPTVSYYFVSMGASSDGQTLYANAQLSAGGVGVWKSTNAGQTWTNITSNATVNVPALANWRQVNNCQCGYDQTMGVDPSDSNRVYMGFQDMWLSEDGGNTWNDVTFTDSTYTVEQMHVDHHALTFSPASHRISGQSVGIWVGNDGGVWNSLNNGTTWNGANKGTTADSSLATHLFRDIDIGRGSGNNGWTYGGTQDNGTSVGNPTSAIPGWEQQWNEWSGGDGSYVGTDWIDPKIAYGNWGNVTYTTDGGQTLNWANINCSQGQAKNFSILQVGPQNRDVYLAGTCNSTPRTFY